MNNGTGQSNTKGSIAILGSDVTVTGTAQNNLYWDATGFNTGGPWSGFTLTNNLAADAQADTYNAVNGFSSTQGQNQWSYQYYNGSTWSNMAIYNSTTPALWESHGAPTATLPESGRI